MYVKKNTLISEIVYGFLFCFIFILSLLLTNIYTGGDQFIYNNAYDSLKGQTLIEAFVSYRFNISSDEPIHFLITWIFSNLNFPKDLLISVSNVLLMSFLFRILQRWNVSLSIIFLIIISNFYLYVLYFAAERLKFGFLFFLISYFYLGDSIKKYFYLLLSFLSHVQILIFPFIFLLSNLNKFFSLRNLLIIIFIGVPICFGIGYYIYDHLLSKYNAYSELAVSKSVFLNTWQIFFFMILSFLYTNKWLKAGFVFAIIAIFSAFLGPERITMIAFIYFMYFSLRVNRGLNLGVLLSSLYYSIKTIFFVYNIIYFNNGFAE